jgi:glyoxylase-like metal-dependent hydrolase (beta-lactamase superfamily II)
MLTMAALSLPQRKLLAAFFPAKGAIRMIRGNAGIYTDRGGTIGFLMTEKGIVTIDSQFPDTAKNYLAAIKDLNKGAVSYLLNTHHHGDHTSGNISFRGIIEHVAAHENAILNMNLSAAKNNNADKQLFPDISFKDEFKLKMGNEKIKGLYFGAAHTNGDAVYHLEEANVVHLGDLMFNRRHPYVDRTAGASIAGWIWALEKIVKEYNKDTIYIFGHAAEGYEVTGSREDLLKFKDYLQRVLDFAQTEFRAGRTKEEFIKNTSIPGEKEWIGTDGARTLTAAYEENTEGG